MNDYQKRARKTAMYLGVRSQHIVYPALGLAGESGEVCEKVKKWLRGDYIELVDGSARSRAAHILSHNKLSDKLEKELGDVLWYIANLATDLGLDLDDIATENLDKLRDRERRNVLQGDGDDR